MTDTSPIDQSEFDALLELLDHDSMRDVVRLFASAAPARLATAREALAAGDAAAVAMAFHTLRSTCGQLGATRLEELCAGAEREAKSAGLGGTQARLRDVERELARCLDWFRERGWARA